MEYRNLGVTGLSVSVIGLGCEGFLGKDEAFTGEMFDYAIANGINCLDLYSPSPNMQRQVGQCIAPVRKDFVLQGHLCTKWKYGQYATTRKLSEVKDNVELMLANLNTDYLDVGMIHYVDSIEDWETVINNGILDYAMELKRTGVIRHIGLSSHSAPVSLKAIRDGVEVLLFSINPCYDLLPGEKGFKQLIQPETFDRNFSNFDPQRMELYEICQTMGIGLTAMKAFGGGQLLSINSPAGKAMTVIQCLHYALTRPGVASVMSGVHSIKQLKESLNYINATEEEQDYAVVLDSFPRIDWHGHCMYCGHCAPCPKGIEIANVIKFLNLCLAQRRVPETVREHYATLKAHASDCIACGICQRRCPFGVDIKHSIMLSVKTFGY